MSNANRRSGDPALSLHRCEFAMWQAGSGETASSSLFCCGYSFADSSRVTMSSRAGSFQRRSETSEDVSHASPLVLECFPHRWRGLSCRGQFQMFTHICPQLLRIHLLVSATAETGWAWCLFEARFVLKTWNLCSSANFQGTLGDREKLVLKVKSFHYYQRNNWFRFGFKKQYVLCPSCFWGFSQG